MVDGIAILVKEEPITLYEIKQRMATEHQDAKTAADALIREQLEAQEIKQRDLNVSGSDVHDRIAQIAAQNSMSVPQLYDAVWNSEHLSQSAFSVKLKQTMLTQKLYRAIAMASMEGPGEEQLREYYRLHPEKFSHPDTFEVTLYTSSDKRALREKMQNPMRYLPEVSTQDVSLPYERIEPQLAALLLKTKDGAFTPILPDPKGGYVSFFVRARSMPRMLPFESVKMQVSEALMDERREQTLKDYFDRARLDADIKIIRMPEGV